MIALTNIKQIISDMEHGVYDFTKDGKCVGCGNCCSNLLPMSEGEINQIRHYIKKHDIKQHRKVAPTVKPFIDMTCPFLDDMKEYDKCTIYPVRPQICRNFICNKPPSKARKDKALFNQNRRTVNVRNEFFGGQL